MSSKKCIKYKDLKGTTKQCVDLLLIYMLSNDMKPLSRQIIKCAYNVVSGRIKKQNLMYASNLELSFFSYSLMDISDNLQLKLNIIFNENTHPSIDALRKLLTKYSELEEPFIEILKNFSEEVEVKENPFKGFSSVICLNDTNFSSDPAIGRENEIEELMLGLLTPDKSVILVGQPGIGKTALVEGFAKLLKEKKVPQKLENMRVYKINTGALVAGTKYRGEFEDKLIKLLEIAKNDPNIILFIDEIHASVNAGAAGDGGGVSMQDILKPYLDRGLVKVIGATTTKEHQKHILSDKAYARRFEVIEMKEPSIEQTIEIVEQLIPRYEQEFKIKFDLDCLEGFIDIISTVTDSSFRIKDVYNPDIALTLLKKSFAHASLKNKSYVDLNDLSKAISSTSWLDENVKAKIIKSIKEANEIIDERVFN